MTAEELRAYLNQQNIRFEERQIQSAVQFRCAEGEIFALYTTGRLVIQGTQTALAEDVRALDAGRLRQPRQTSQPVREAQVATQLPHDRQVFIVYGHDDASRDSLELLLRRMGLEPVVLQNLPAGGDTIIEKLEHYLGEHGNVGFACVLLTPDDEGHEADRPEDKKYRARQNVVLELGMVLGHLGRRRVAILHKETVELPSDIAGLIYIPFQERVEEVRNRLFRELQTSGYNPRPDAL